MQKHPLKMVFPDLQNSTRFTQANNKSDRLTATFVAVNVAHN
jgi:hypothetical protein